MTNEEILTSEPEGATHIEILSGTVPYYIKCEITPDANYSFFDRENAWHKLKNGPSGDVRSLSDIRRIVELEKEVERLNAHNQIFDAATALNDDLKQKLEAAERERDDYKRIAVDAATESFLIAADNEIKRALAQENKSASAINHCQHQFHCAARSCAIDCVNNQLRQQLNGGE